MARYHLVRGGEIVETRDFEGQAPRLAPNKGRWLPEAVEGYEPFDPVRQVRSGPVQTIGPSRVLQTYAVRDKNDAEKAAMQAAKEAALEAEFRRRGALPIAFTVASAGEKLWHADERALKYIMGVVLMIAVAPSAVPNPRPWTAYDELIPTDVTHAEFVGLGGAIMSREDALYVRKKTLEAQLLAMTDPADIEAFDPLAGWDA